MRHLLFLSVLLLGASWAMAQSSQGQVAPSETSPSQETSVNAGGDTTVQGCLSGSDGNYMLTAKDGTTYHLSGDTAKLSEHVGHEIKVTGSTASSTKASGADDATDSMGKSPKQTLEVSSVKHISKSCEGGGGMSH